MKNWAEKYGINTAVSPLTLGWIIAIASTVCFSVAPPIARGAILAGLAPTAVLVGRMAIALALLVIFIAVTSPGRFVIERRLGWIAFLSGIINGIGFIAFFVALTRLDASIASMLFSLSPLVVLGLLTLRGERMTQRHVVRLALGVGGVYLLIGPGGEVDMVGVALVLVTVFTVSLHLVMTQWYLPNIPARTVTLYVNLGVTAVCLMAWQWAGRPWTAPGPSGWASILALAVISTFLARLLLFAGVRRLGSGQIALLAPLETLLTVIWSFLFLGERLTAVQWLGGLFILLSMALARRWRPWPRL
ncbi:MAG TPA: DMT family transporter [Chloroflexota bacterium]|nr:DMT family transporter [Chloroflexota bacterium]